MTAALQRGGQDRRRDVADRSGPGGALQRQGGCGAERPHGARLGAGAGAGGGSATAAGADGVTRGGPQ